MLGVPLGFVVAQGLPRLRRFWEPALAWPFALPASIAALQVLPGLDRLGWSYTESAVVTVMVLLNAPYVALRTAQALAQLDPRLAEQAAVLGAKRSERFRRVLAPALAPAWGGAAAEVYLACVHSLSLVMILGGGPPVETVEVTLFHRLRGGALDWTGSLIAGALLGILSLPAAWALASGAGARVQNLYAAEISEKATNRVAGALAILGLVLLVGVWVFPLLGIFSIRLTTESAQELAHSFLGSASLAAGVVAVILATAIGWVSAVRSPRRLAYLAAASALASAISPMLLALVLIFAQLAMGQDPFGYPRAVLSLALFLAFLPFAIRNLLWLQVSRPEALSEAARVCGASRTQAWWAVEWPRWRQPVGALGGLLFLWVLGESSLTWLFTSGSESPWVTALLARWAGQYRIEDAQAGTLLMLALSAIGFFALNARRRA